MEFHFKDKTDQIIKIEERLKDMTLAYKIISLENETVPFFKDGSKKYVGIDAMNRYLDLLDSEKEHWYYCNC